MHSRVSTLCISNWNAAAYTIHIYIIFLLSIYSEFFLSHVRWCTYSENGTTELLVGSKWLHIEFFSHMPLFLPLKNNNKPHNTLTVAKIPVTKIFQKNVIPTCGETAM